MAKLVLVLIRVLDSTLPFELCRSTRPIWSGRDGAASLLRLYANASTPHPPGTEESVVLRTQL